MTGEPAGQIRRVLIADDDPVTRSMLTECFKKDGFGVVTAADGIEACSIALGETPDLAVVDLLLPRRDGYSVLLYLRSREETRGMPVLILSGESSEEHPKLARTLGAQGYVAKPVDPRSILAAARDAMAGARSK